MTRKLVSLLLCLAMLLSCTAALAEEQVTITYPLENATPLEYWVSLHADAAMYISNYDEAEAWQNVQEKTGVDLTFIHPAAGQEKVTLQLLLSDPKTMPDIIQYSNFAGTYEGGMISALDDGAIVDLTDLLPIYAPDYWALVKDNPLFQTADGRYAAFYSVNFGPYGYTAYYPLVRQDLIDEYGSFPSTIDELENFCQWILDTKPGMTPMALPVQGGAAWFQLTGGFDFITDWFVDKTGTVKHGYGSEEYKDYLEVMNRWYEKGYIRKDFASYVFADVQSQFLNNQLGIYFSILLTQYPITEAQGIEITKLPYLKRNAEDTGFPFLPTYSPNRGESTVITTNCDDIPGALRFLNYAYTEEGKIAYNYGIEGLSWNYDENGKIVYEDRMINPTDIHREAGNYMRRIHFAPKWAIRDQECNPSSLAGGEKTLYYRALHQEKPENDNSYRLPVYFSLTAEETAERADIMTDLLTYAKEQEVMFIDGRRSLDTWDAYMDELNAMGYADAQKLMQDAYDRLPDSQK